ncbi:MAG: DUF4405 domain-containing protein [Candidatus Omnitrophota bacterium]
MKRSLMNLGVDILSLVTFCLMISTGVILKYILPPGSGRTEILLGGGRGQRAIDLFISLARHQWGEIHFFISIGFLVLLLIHLIMHWSWIVCMLWGTPHAPHNFLRRVGVAGIIFIILAVLAFPWIAWSLGAKQTVTRQTYTQTLQ